ncbi:LysR family transcriptional regulator [Ursidibacter maritimus]|uniref:LysR family transcriptional regulator n=1 Tax=Ursidibacter maritimus TaxID=1331689 RepID=A0A949T357_9PAST|nr:LysR family transcriptional regulator [Ursidibacter maritimus]KAE9541934.1 transcriptional regulator [Ursidibacter maritimus]MBV6523265.1 LysR family transcriptional regulator [Ursidibacter maritimus]MBV6525721.1 LysR family transcriptional regulator [Ursidibacter maritimus]MBV6527383.1 LysR family transcriptional regulator [Ursidibacter maritimus]MBV6529408.1 LysR family transcriptional regulator [Ursidibacter maritimus]
MYDYKSITIFTAVVEQGSMQAAANLLSLTPSAITQAIQKLETQLNIKLLNRTTRKLSLTEAGDIFYQHAAKMQQSAEDAMKSVEILRSQPIGQLTIACVTGLTDSLLTSAFKSVLDNHPEFRLNLLFEDTVIDLLEQRVDIALRAGSGVLSNNMIARHIYDFKWAIVAHRQYFQDKAIPTSLAELAKLDWIDFSNPNFNSLTFNNGNQKQVITPIYRISCNTLYASRRLTMQGLGISIQPIDDVQADIASGELIQLFIDWQLPPVPLYLVTLQRIQSEKVRIACELIMNYFAKLKQ